MLLYNKIRSLFFFSLVLLLFLWWNEIQHKVETMSASAPPCGCNATFEVVLFIPSLAVSYFALISSLRLFLKTLIYSAHCCFNRLTPRGRDYYGVALSVNWSWACDYITITRIHRYISSLARRSAHSPIWILLLVCLKSASLAGLWRSVSPWERGRLQIKSLAPLNSDT